MLLMLSAFTQKDTPANWTFQQPFRVELEPQGALQWCWAHGCDTLIGSVIHLVSGDWARQQTCSPRVALAA
jgi:hypothetical protein